MPVLSLADIHYSRTDLAPLLSGVTFALPPGRTGLVGPNGAGKSTLLDLAAGRLSPTSGTVHRDGRVGLVPQMANPELPLAALFGRAEALQVLRRAERGEATADELAGAEWDLEARLGTALSFVGLGGVDLLATVGRLSGGQRNRAALSAAFFDAPDLVLLDEPTNNLDGEGREILSRLLEAHRGAALIASHDRAFLRGVDQILELRDGQVTLFGGGWEDYARERAAAAHRAQQRLERAERAARSAEREIAQSRQRAASRARIGKAKRRDGSQGKMLMNAEKERSERTDSSSARLAARRRDEARRDLEEARGAQSVTVERRLQATAADRTALRLLEFSEVGFAWPDGGDILRDLSFTLYRGERLAVAGPNGSGKSTLLRLAAGLQEPGRGRIWRPDRVAFLDQQADILGRHGALAERFRAVHPGLDVNSTHAALARMGFRGAGGQADVGQLSGGERMQAALALVLASPEPPDLLILDEPGNHLDIDALEAVEAGLSAFGGAMLLVSHDPVFLDHIGMTRRIDLRSCG